MQVLHNSYIDLFLIGHYFSSPVRLPGRHLQWPEARCVGESQATRPNTIIRLSSLTITMPPTTDCDCTTFHSPGSAVVRNWDNVMGDGDGSHWGNNLLGWTTFPTLSWIWISVGMLCQNHWLIEKPHENSWSISAVIAQILIHLFWFFLPKLWPYGSDSVHKNNLIIKFS